MRHYQGTEMGFNLRTSECGSAGCISGWMAAYIACDGVAWQQPWKSDDYDALLQGYMATHDDAFNPNNEDYFDADAPEVIAHAFKLTHDETQVMIKYVYTVMDAAEALANFAVLFGLDTTSSSGAPEGHGQS